MRHVTDMRCQRGLTLIELMIAVAIGAFLMLTAAPYLGDYMANSRLREGGNMLYSEALAAQSEAVKRNTTVRLQTNGATIGVYDRTDPANPVLLRERTFGGGVSAAAATIDFGGEGRPIGFAAGSIDLSMANVTCSGDFRCPGLRVDGGGAVRLCTNHLATC